MKAAAILCPGPSLNETIPTVWKRYKRIVAVTDAIYADAPFTHFTMQEIPNKARREAYSEEIVKKGVEVWGYGGHLKYWKERMELPPETAVDCTTKVAKLVKELPYETKVAPIKTKFDSYAWCVGPTFYALARCIVDGYEEIDIYGSDFRGRTNFHPRTGEPLRGERDYERRWAGERKHLTDIIEEAQAHAVRVRHVLPPVDDGLSRSIYGVRVTLGSSEGSGGGDQQSDLHPTSSAR